MLENSPVKELEQVICFCIKVGILILKELGVIDVDSEKIIAVAKAACAKNDTLHNMPFKVTEESVYAAIVAADALGSYYIELQGKN